MKAKAIIIFLVCFTLFSGISLISAEPYDVLFPVIKDGKSGYIDINGKIVVEPQFEHGWAFFDGMAAISLNGKWGYLDLSGKVKIEPQFDEAWQFVDGLAWVRKGE